ncbi:Eco57I restriction-modification methylase domain-containing protein [Dokdonia sp. Hel_I_53]|uniref:Eco57I restriction-modification methylase domain-containing protein n=1 Tax=Dokdonia sp. Hel_I_53 TaxID=1566287 RepID=UPI00119B24A8|nr:N-6 DNA methylase [Dokdonia sp. Hel_I_53]TVZ51368.1 N-6 DNA methylase [Dokdonia sp. Hel_I_53]
MSIEQRREALTNLVNRYNQFKEEGRLDLTSEETIRTWLNEMLGIFGWDVQDTSQILQEKTLTQAERDRLREIGSTSTRPDYTFKLGKEKLTFLDAKDITVNLNTDTSASFQIKSYGWSILAPCAFISNFEQFAIYDCGYIPNREQAAGFGRIFLTVDEYIDNFELLDNHLFKPNIYGGRLAELYSGNEVEGIKKVSPDFAFANFLSGFRLSLAGNILENNNEVVANDTSLLSYVVQVIINRILFIRVCEARRLEENALLLQFKEEGFWERFKESSYLDFYQHYDGPLFERIDSIHNLTINNEIFDELLSYLYYPSPYRFDVIPTKLLGDIYEIFLSKKLILTEEGVSDILKTEYIKSKGAVSTPQFLVDDIIKRTLIKQNLIDSGVEGVLSISALDIACGSGVFLIGLYDYLEDIVLDIQSNSPNEAYNHLFSQTETELILNLRGKQAIIKNCIYGVDIDPEAVEVAKMSLALKVIDNEEYPEASEQIGLFGEQILNGIGLNVRCGNSLVDSSVLTQYPEILDNDEELFKTRPFDWQTDDYFRDVFDNKGGFDFIVGNPPYVEVKHFNTELPFMHSFIKDTYTTGNNGKIDLAVPFLERGLSILNDNGRLGFIVQKRFFKTDYGSKIRELISSGSHLSTIVDFTTQSIFKGKMTYVATLVLNKSPKEQFYYHKTEDNIETLPAYLRELLIAESDETQFYNLPSESITANPWSFDDPSLLSVKLDLAGLGTFGNVVNVKVGLQALKNEAYHITATNVTDGIITGRSNWQDNITIEEGACRPLMCNVQFYPFRPDTTNTYVIFPYDIIDGEKREISYPEFCERYPLAGAYLDGQRERLEGPVANGGVQTMPIRNPQRYTEDFWHIYTRANNIEHIYPKVLVPMTTMDTFATVTLSDKIYCDNANMFFIQIDEVSEDRLFAVSGIINSVVFSVLGRSIANPQSNGYFKFNKQFLEPIPFPVENFNNSPELVGQLATVSRDIKNRQDQYRTNPNNRNTLIPVLRQLWNQLDNLVYSLYDLNEDQIAFFNERGRNIDRVTFLNNWM